LCRLEWNKDSRKIKTPAQESSDTVSTTRRLRIFDSEGNFPDAYLVFVMNEKLNATGTWSLGRVMDTTQVNIRQVQRWIDVCLKGHGERCNTSHGAVFDKIVRNPWFKVIDVQAMAIVESPRRRSLLSAIFGVCHQTLG
jgi:hypothetical protein